MNLFANTEWDMGIGVRFVNVSDPDNFCRCAGSPPLRGAVGPVGRIEECPVTVLVD
jgi:hypothetical protein